VVVDEEKVVLVEQVAVYLVAYLTGKVEEGAALGVGRVFNVGPCTAVLILFDEDVDEFPLLGQTAYIEALGTGLLSQLSHSALLHMGVFEALREGDVGLRDDDWFRGWHSGYGWRSRGPWCELTLV